MVGGQGIKFANFCSKSEKYFYTERHKSLRIHTQRYARVTLYGGFKINNSKYEYASYYDAVYN